MNIPKDYWDLTAGERVKGFVRPVRNSYRHIACDGISHLSKRIAETFASTPRFYSSTFCSTCGRHYPIAEFRWLDGEQVGS